MVSRWQRHFRRNQFLAANSRRADSGWRALCFDGNERTRPNDKCFGDLDGSFRTSRGHTTAAGPRAVWNFCLSAGCRFRRPTDGFPMVSKWCQADERWTNQRDNIANAWLQRCGISGQRELHPDGDQRFWQRHRFGGKRNRHTHSCLGR